MAKQYTFPKIIKQLQSKIELIKDAVYCSINANEIIGENSTNILYIGEYFPARIQRVLKVSKDAILHQKILLISEWGYEPKLIGDVFDKVIVYRNKYHLKTILKKAQGTVLVHAFEPKAEFQYTTKQHINAPFIYDLQDIIITYYGFEPPLKWQKRNLKYEQLLLSQSDGFIAYSLELNEAQRIYKTKNNQSKRLFFPLFCDEANFKPIANKSIQARPHLVYIGGINSTKDRSSSNFLPFIKQIEHKNINLTIFPSPFSERLCYDEYKQLENQYKHFKMERSVPFNQLNLTKFDFGVVPFEHHNSEKYYTKNKYASTLKFFVYLEMGIPIIISEYWTFPAWITKRYQLGIVTTFDAIETTNFQMSDVDYQTMLKNIEAFRNNFSLQKNSQKLINFYKSFL